MNIKLSQWEPNNDSTKPGLLGNARIDLNEKMYVWMAVMRSSKGNIFVKFPSVRLNGEFQAAIGWPGQNIEGKIRDAIMSDLQKRLEEEVTF